MPNKELKKRINETGSKASDAHNIASKAHDNTNLTKNSVGIFCFIQGGLFVVIGLGADLLGKLACLHSDWGIGWVQWCIVGYGLVWMLGGLYIRRG